MTRESQERSGHSSCSPRNAKTREKDGTAFFLDSYVLQLGHVFSKGLPTTETRKSPVGIVRPTNKLRSYRISRLDQNFGPGPLPHTNAYTCPKEEISWMPRREHTGHPVFFLIPFPVNGSTIIQTSIPFRGIGSRGGFRRSFSLLLTRVTMEEKLYYVSICAYVADRSHLLFILPNSWNY